MKSLSSAVPAGMCLLSFIQLLEGYVNLFLYSYLVFIVQDLELLLTNHWIELPNFDNFMDCRVGGGRKESPTMIYK